MDWLHSYEGQGFLQLAMQLWSDTPQAEGVVDAIMIKSEEMLGAWPFISAKRAMAIKGLQIFQSLVYRIHDGEELRKQVIFQDLSKHEALTRIKRTLGGLGEASNAFKEFMQFAPDEQALLGLNFLIGRGRADCRNDRDFENLIALIKGDSLQLVTREHTPPPSLLLLEAPTLKAIYDTLMNELTLVKALEVGAEMPLLSRGHIPGWLAGEITKLSRDMEDLKEVEWSIPIMQEYILQVEDLGDAVKGILNMELDVAVPQMVALPSKLAQALKFTWYMIPEGWINCTFNT